jgi:hypothetical protein
LTGNLFWATLTLFAVRRFVREVRMQPIWRRPEVARAKTIASALATLAVVFNNFWYTNFVANENGAMEFPFDLLGKPSIPDPQALADTVVSEPVVVQK